MQRRKFFFSKFRPNEKITIIAKFIKLSSPKIESLCSHRMAFTAEK